MGVAARLPSSLSLSPSRFGVALAPRFRMGVFRLYSLRAEPGGGSGGVFGLGGVLCRFLPAELSRVSEPARSSLSAPCIAMGLSGQSPAPDTPPSISRSPDTRHAAVNRSKRRGDSQASTLQKTLERFSDFRPKLGVGCSFQRLTKVDSHGLRG